MSLLAKYFNIRTQIGCVLFYSFLYDLIRAGYLETKRRHLQALKRQPIQAYFQHEFLNSCPYSRASVSSSSSSSSSSRSNSTFSTKSNDNNNNNQPRSSLRIVQWTQQLELPTSKHRTIGAMAWASMKSLLKSNCSANSSWHRKDYDDCPLPPMPQLIRYYEYFSHTLVAISWLKYLLLFVLYHGLFNTDKTISCYIPGRTAVLPEYCPDFSLIVLSYHVMFRLYLCKFRRSFNVDYFLFVLYPRERVAHLEAKFYAIQQRRRRQSVTSLTSFQELNSMDEELRKLYEANRPLMYRFRHSNKRYSYKLKSNRNLKQWIEAEEFMFKFTLVFASNFIFWSVPLGALILSLVLSTDGYAYLYDHCNALEDDMNPSKWPFTDWRRWVWFVFDLIDSGWLLFDTANALVWPFSSLVLCAHDMCISIESLSHSASGITKRLTRTLHTTTTTTNSNQHREREQKLVEISEDTLAFQSELSEVMQQMHQTDQFVSKLSAFCIFCWIMTNLYYQLQSLNAQSLFVPKPVVQFMQFTAFTAITGTYVYLTRAHSLSRQLYRKICNLVALNPDLRIKSSWLWLLEYYSKDCSRYSFHLGPWAELSLSNYLKSISWLITGALITIDLYSQKFKETGSQSGHKHVN